MRFMKMTCVSCGLSGLVKPSVNWHSSLGLGFSVGICDRTAKFCLAHCGHQESIPRELVSQHLDDVCAAAPAGDDKIYAFDN